VVQELDAGAKGRLEETAVGGGDSAPLQGVEVGGEVAGLVDSGDFAESVGFGALDSGAKLELPEDLELSALVVVVEADELY
jgi:hypothetical protein